MPRSRASWMRRPSCSTASRPRMRSAWRPSCASSAWASTPKADPAPSRPLSRSHKIGAMRLSRLKRLPSRVKRAARYEIHAHWRSRPIVQGSVLYESFSGNGMLDNPEAIFRELLAAPDLGRLTHIWALSDLTQYRAAVEEFA